jgi:hypothetical protein
MKDELYYITITKENNIDVIKINENKFTQKIHKKKEMSLSVENIDKLINILIQTKDSLSKKKED